MSNATNKSEVSKKSTAKSDSAVEPKQRPAISKKSDLPWGALVSVALVIVTFFLSSLAGSIYTWLYTIRIHHWTDAQANQWLNNSVDGQFIYGLLVYAVWIGLFWLFLPLYGVLIGKGISFFAKKWRSIFRAVGWSKPQWRDIPYALAGFGIYFICYVLVVAILEKIFHGFNAGQQQDIGFQGGTHGSALVLVFFSLVVLPPLVEETVFRGFLFSGLKKSMPIVWAAVITSLLFAIPHLFEGADGQLLIVGGVDTFILSLVLVYLRQQTNSLWASIGLHMLKNGVAFATLFFFAHIIV